MRSIIPPAFHNRRPNQGSESMTSTPLESTINTTDPVARMSGGDTVLAPRSSKTPAMHSTHSSNINYSAHIQTDTQDSNSNNDAVIHESDIKAILSDYNKTFGDPLDQRVQDLEKLALQISNTLCNTQTLGHSPDIAKDIKTIISTLGDVSKLPAQTTIPTALMDMQKTLTHIQDTVTTTFTSIESELSQFKDRLNSNTSSGDQGIIAGSTQSTDLTTENELITFKELVRGIGDLSKLPVDQTIVDDLQRHDFAITGLQNRGVLLGDLNQFTSLNTLVSQFQRVRDTVTGLQNQSISLTDLGTRFERDHLDLSQLKKLSAALGTVDEANNRTISGTGSIFSQIENHTDQLKQFSQYIQLYQTTKNTLVQLQSNLQTLQQRFTVIGNTTDLSQDETVFSKLNTLKDNMEELKHKTLLEVSGPWDHASNYNAGACVTYSGSAYYTQRAIQAGKLPPSQNPIWILMAEKGAAGINGIGLTPQGVWDEQKFYNINDVVQLRGSSYYAIQQNSASPPSTNPAKWVLLAKQGPQGITGNVGARWCGAWVETQTYSQNDIVCQDGSSYVCIQDLTDGTHIPGQSYAKWLLVSKRGDVGANGEAGLGLYFRGPWLSTNTYNERDLVMYEGNCYYSPTKLSPSVKFNKNQWLLFAAAGQAGASGAQGQAGEAGFNFTGQWESREYKKRDCVTINHNVYMCVAPFTSEKPEAPNQQDWVLFIGRGETGPQGLPGVPGTPGTNGIGFKFAGEWRTNTLYDTNTIVTHDGTAYIWPSDQVPVGTSEFNPSSWHLFASGTPGICFKGEWNNTDAYKRTDAVYYQGSCYFGIKSSTGIVPTSNGASDVWTILVNQGERGPPGQEGAAGVGFHFRGEWLPRTTYNVGDVVRYEGSSYISKRTTSFISGNIFLTKDWDMMASQGKPGFNFRDAYVNTAMYDAHDVVTYNGSTFLCIENGTTNEIPDEKSIGWQLLAAKGQDARGLVFTGEFKTNKNYALNDVVYSQGSSYRCRFGLKTTITDLPASKPSDWEIIAAKGADGISPNHQVPTYSELVLSKSTILTNTTLSTAPFDFIPATSEYPSRDVSRDAVSNTEDGITIKTAGLYRIQCSYMVNSGPGISHDVGDALLTLESYISFTDAEESYSKKSGPSTIANIPWNFTLTLTHSTTIPLEIGSVLRVNVKPIWNSSIVSFTSPHILQGGTLSIHRIGDN